MATCCHHLLHNTTTIEVGDDIIVLTFFATKPSKKAMTIPVKAIETSDGSYRRVFLILKHKEKGDGNKLLSPLWL